MLLPPPVSVNGHTCITDTTALGIGIKLLPSRNDAVMELSDVSVEVEVVFALALVTSSSVIRCLRYIFSMPS